MTRLVVKNLPKTVTEEQLRTIFGQKGTITDIQLKYTKEGVFRRFAFIGYQTDEEANIALKYFNNSCIQTNRVKIEKCVPLGAEDKPKSWSKYSLDSSAYRKKHGLDEIEQQKVQKEKEERKSKKKNVLEDIFGEHKNDPEFIEFLEAHDKNRTLWANDAKLVTNDDVNKDDGVVSGSNNTNESRANIKQSEDSADEGSEISTHEEETPQSDELDEDPVNEKTANKDISDLEYMKTLMTKKPEKIVAKKERTAKSKKGQADLFTIKIYGMPYNTKRQDVIRFFKPSKPYSVRLPAKVHGFCYAGFKTEQEFKKAMLKNKSFLKGKQVFFSDFTEKNVISKNKDENQEQNEDHTHKNPKWLKQEQALKSEEDISESGKIFFRNLAYTVTEDDLRNLFEKYGPIAEINLPIDPLTRQIKGFGTVTFVMPENAVQAYTELDGNFLHGRLLHLLPGKSKENEGEDENTEGLSFKEKKALKLKKSAQQSYNWNTLFLGTNAVAEILAKQLGESKETILDMRSGGSSAAVRLALGETQIVMEMKKFLEENDVRLDAFDTAPKKRSNTIILAKNLPAETTVPELKPLFTKYGVVGRIILPPSGVTAIIEFQDPSEAKQAFKNLAYSKFKNLPLYLEWAPETTLKTPLNGVTCDTEQKDEIKLTEKTSYENTEESSKKVDDTHHESTEETEDDEPPEQGATLFLRNLNFKTREGAIREHFKHLGKIHMVQVAMKKDPENPQNKIPLGYGFIQFKKKKTADQALKDMHFTQIEGNQVELKRSDRVLKTEANVTRKKTTSMKQTGTKILVKNVSFQAKANEIREIFQVFGHIKSIRLPVKPKSGEEQHRGFCFVDFFDKSSAKKAFEALHQSTHLYGRRLVLEWAETTDNDVNELRKRTAEQFTSSDGTAKRSRKAVFDSSNISDVKVDDDIMD